jgi:hypothetical protein
LVARVVSRILGEVPQTLERVTEETDWPHNPIISNWI